MNGASGATAMLAATRLIASIGQGNIMMFDVRLSPIMAPTNRTVAFSAR
jgi:hypothetical protein